MRKIRGVNWILLIVLEGVIIIGVVLSLQPYLLQKQTLFSFKNNPQFSNIFDSTNIAKMAFTQSIALVDFNNDNLTDIYMGGGMDGSRLYKNLGNYHFTDVTPASFNKLIRASGGVFADYDNDGCKDLFVPNSGGHDVLLKGDCRGGFVDVTKKSGAVANSQNHFSAAWADYDNDGFLDIYTTGNSAVMNGKVIYRENALYRNNGDGTFTEKTEIAGILGVANCDRDKFPHKEYGKNLKRSYQPIWFDYNNDGKMDLFVSTDFDASPLYRNNGDGTFTDVTQVAGLCKYGTNMGVAIGDFYNRGYFDIYAVNEGDSYFWKNNGNGTFKVLENGTSNKESIGWGANALDYDNDGHLDIYIANGIARSFTNHTYDSYLGVLSYDRLYENLSNGKFKNMATEAGIAGGDNKWSSAVGYLNKNGFPDILVIPAPFDDAPIYRFYKNTGNSNNWIGIKLIGGKSNRDSVGARIYVTAGGFQQMRAVAAGSSILSQDDTWQTVGLGKAKIIDKIMVKWPSGRTKILYKIKPNQRIVIEEP